MSVELFSKFEVGMEPVESYAVLVLVNKLHEALLNNRQQAAIIVGSQLWLLGALLLYIAKDCRMNSDAYPFVDFWVKFFDQRLFLWQTQEPIN